MVANTDRVRGVRAEERIYGFMDLYLLGGAGFPGCVISCRVWDRIWDSSSSPIFFCVSPLRKMRATVRVFLEKGSLVTKIKGFRLVRVRVDIGRHCTDCMLLFHFLFF